MSKTSWLDLKLAVDTLLIWLIKVLYIFWVSGPWVRTFHQIRVNILLLLTAIGKSFPSGK